MAQHDHKIKKSNLPTKKVVDCNKNDADDNVNSAIQIHTNVSENHSLSGFF